MTRDQLDASVKEPWTRTMVGLVAAAAGFAEIAPPKIAAAVSRPAANVRMEMRRNILGLLWSRRSCTSKHRRRALHSHPGAPWSARWSHGSRGATRGSPGCDGRAIGGRLRHTNRFRKSPDE